MAQDGGMENRGMDGMDEHTSVNEFARGWTVLLAAFLGIGVSLVSLTYYSAGIWVKPWQAEFGWSRTDIGISQSVATLSLVVMAPLAGKFIDRFGLRLVGCRRLGFCGRC